MRFGKLAGAIGVALAATMSIAGCGGSDEKVASPSTATSTQASGGAWAKLQSDYSAFLTRRCDSSAANTATGATEFAACAGMLKAEVPSFVLGVKELPSSKPKNDILAATDRLKTQVQDYDDAMCVTQPNNISCSIKATLITSTHENIIVSVVAREAKAGS